MSTTDRPDCDVCHLPMARTPNRRSYYCPNTRDRLHRDTRRTRRERADLERLERTLSHLTTEATP